MTHTPLLPTEAEHFKARYALWLGGSFLLVGIITTLLSLWMIATQGSFNSSILVSLVLGAVGFLYLTRPYFAIAPNRITIYNLIGKSVKRYPFATFSHIVVDNDSLYIEGADEPGGQRERVKVNKRLVRSKDWAHVEAIARQPSA